MDGLAAKSQLVEDAFMSRYSYSNSLYYCLLQHIINEFVILIYIGNGTPFVLLQVLFISSELSAFDSRGL